MYVISFKRTVAIVHSYARFELSLKDESYPFCLFLTRRGVGGIRGVARGWSLI